MSEGGEPSCQMCELVLERLSYAAETMKPDEHSLNLVKSVLQKESQNGETAVWKALLAAGPKIAKGTILSLSPRSIRMDKEQLSQWKEFHHFASRGDHLSCPKTLTLPDGDEIATRRGLSDDHYQLSKSPLMDLAEIFIGAQSKENGAEKWTEILNLCEYLPNTPYMEDSALFKWANQRIGRCIPSISSQATLEFWVDEFDNFGMMNLFDYHPFINYSSYHLNEISPQVFFGQIKHPSSNHFWWEAIENLGPIAEHWKKQLSENDEDTRIAKHLPSLIVSEGRLKILLAGENGFTSRPVPKDPAVWRHLLAWSLYHPKSAENQFLRAIQLEFLNIDKPKQIAPAPEIRAMQLLGGAAEGLGNHVEVNGGALLVTGTSGVSYTISPIGVGYASNLFIQAHPNRQTARQKNHGIHICIAFNSETSQELPLADRLAAYLLTLRDDERSSENISTLEHFLKEWVGRGGNLRKRRDDIAWKRLQERFPDGFAEQDDEWDDEWDDGWDDCFIDDWDEEDDDDEEQKTSNHEGAPSSNNDTHGIIGNPPYTMGQRTNVHQTVLRWLDGLPNGVVEGLEFTDEERAEIDDERWKLEAAARGESHCL